MADTQFEVRGQINVFKTINAFCSRGKRMENIFKRARIQNARKLSVAIVYDDSNSMTAWWRADYLNKKIGESEAPQAFAKIAVMALCEALGKEADISLVVFGSKAKLWKKIDYAELLARNGSGATRLDKAIALLASARWEKRGGARVLVILTDGVPEGGNEEIEEDARIQRKCADELARFAREGCRTVFLSLEHEEKLARKKLGGNTLKSYSQLLAKKHVITKSAVPQQLSATLFQALKEATA